MDRQTDMERNIAKEGQAKRRERDGERDKQKELNTDSGFGKIERLV